MRVADLASLHCISNSLVVVVEAAVEANLELDTLLLYQSEQSLDLCDIIVNRLLAEDMLASLDCFHRNLTMGVGGRTNHNNVDIRVVDDVHIIGGSVGDASLCQPLACAGLVQHRISCCDNLSAFDVIEQVVDVELADTAASDYAKT